MRARVPPTTRAREFRTHVEHLPPKRRMLVEAARAEPGLTFTALAGRLRLSKSGIAWHVRELERARSVITIPVGCRKLVYATPVDFVEYPEDRALLLEGSARTIALAILANPGEGIVEAIQMTGISRRAVYHNVKRLVDAGLVSAQRGYTSLSCAPRLVELLAGD